MIMKQSTFGASASPSGVTATVTFSWPMRDLRSSGVQRLSAGKWDAPPRITIGRLGDTQSLSTDISAVQWGKNHQPIELKGGWSTVKFRHGSPEIEFPRLPILCIYCLKFHSADEKSNDLHQLYSLCSCSTNHTSPGMLEANLRQIEQIWYH